MTPDLRRIVAIEAHRRATGRCPGVVHALGTGESFAIAPTANGFVDAASGIATRVDDGLLLAGEARIRLVPRDDVLFDGEVLGTAQRFSGRAGGGASVTLYAGTEYFQYAFG